MSLDKEEEENHVTHQKGSPALVTQCTRNLALKKNNNTNPDHVLITVYGTE